MEKRVQKVKELSITTMEFNEFIAFIGTDFAPPEGTILVPMYTLGYPYYAVWLFDVDLIKRMRGAR
jgi:hypothetical protein